LAAVPDEAEIIVIHDAARPLATAALFAVTIKAVRSGADGAVVAAPVPDTLKRVDGQHRSHGGLAVVGTVDRADLWAVQTPQAFRAAVLRRAHAGDPEASDDAALVEAAGGLVVVVEGGAANPKLTHPYDLGVADAILGNRE
jgi:2-C-methyl-D-erythritol 4-phosphate cytidylyltransferase